MQKKTLLTIAINYIKLVVNVCANKLHFHLLFITTYFYLNSDTSVNISIVSYAI